MRTLTCPLCGAGQPAWDQKLETGLKEILARNFVETEKYWRRRYANEDFDSLEGYEAGVLAVQEAIAKLMEDK